MSTLLLSADRDTTEGGEGRGGEGREGRGGREGGSTVTMGTLPRNCVVCQMFEEHIFFVNWP